MEVAERVAAGLHFFELNCEKSTAPCECEKRFACTILGTGGGGVGCGASVPLRTPARICSYSWNMMGDGRAMVGCAEHREAFGLREDVDNKLRRIHTRSAVVGRRN